MQVILTQEEHTDLLHYNKELKQLKHYQKTGRSFIVDTDTKQIIKEVVNQ